MHSSSSSRRSFLVTSGLLALPFALGGCLDDEPGTQRTVTMTNDLRFSPESMTLTVGEELEWINTSDIDHTVTAYEAGLPENATYFASGGFTDEQQARQHVTRGLIPPEDRYVHTFETPGQYSYYCIPHESGGMTGSVRVRPD